MATGTALKVCSAVGRDTVHSRLGAAAKVVTYSATPDTNSSATRSRNTSVALIDNRLPKEETMFQPARAVG